MKRIYKAGIQSEDSNDPFLFTMSTDEVDRMGDVVEQDWNLKNFRSNPIALFGHKSDLPIGIWKNLKVVNNRLIGRLSLAKQGTSPFIDTLRSLVEQRILRTVSVGFISHNQVPLDEDDKSPFGPMRLSDNELLECSLVTVPANASATNALMKAFEQLGDDSAKKLIREMESSIELKSASEQLGLKRDSSASTTFSRNSKMPTRAEKIKALQDDIVSLRDQLIETEKKYDDESEDNVDERSILRENLDSLTQAIDDKQKDLDMKLQVERRLIDTAAERQQEKSESIEGELVERETTPALYNPQRSRHMGDYAAPASREKGARAISTISALYVGHVTRRNPVDVAKSMYRGRNDIETVVRAATVEADSTTSGWAAELVQETWAEFLALVRDIAVYPRIPGPRLLFGRNGSIHIPYDASDGTELAGAWVGEGAPIPVRQALVGSQLMPSHKLAVISTFTKELARHSTPQIETFIRGRVTGDTAKYLDASFLDNSPGTALRPPGLQDSTATGAGNINASAGNTVANIIADGKGAIGRLLGANSTDQAVWVMNRLRVLGLQTVQDAASGVFTFRDEVAGGSFMGYPIITSKNVPGDAVFLISTDALVMGNDFGINFDVSDQATLVFESDSALVEHIVGGTGKTPPLAGTATTMPVRSMFQVDGVAIKMTVGLSWSLVRQGGVQVLTGVGW